MIIKQGDSYSLPVEVKIDDVVITSSDVSKVEFVFECGETIHGESTIVKEYPSEDVTFDTDHFIVSLTGDETSSFSGALRYQVRVTLTDNSVRVSPTMLASVSESLNNSSTWGSGTATTYTNGDEVLY